MHRELQFIQEERDRHRCELAEIIARLMDQRELQREVALGSTGESSLDGEIVLRAPCWTKHGYSQLASHHDPTCHCVRMAKENQIGVPEEVTPPILVHSQPPPTPTGTLPAYSSAPLAHLPLPASSSTTLNILRSASTTSPATAPRRWQDSTGDAPPQLHPGEPGPEQALRVSYGCSQSHLNNCWRLRDKIQEMIEKRKLSFNAVKPPHVQNNAFPDHGSSSDSTVNMIDLCIRGKDETQGGEPISPFYLNVISWYDDPYHSPNLFDSLILMGPGSSSLSSDGCACLLATRESIHSCGSQPWLDHSRVAMTTFPENECPPRAAPHWSCVEQRDFPWVKSDAWVHISKNSSRASFLILRQGRGSMLDEQRPRANRIFASSKAHQWPLGDDEPLGSNTFIGIESAPLCKASMTGATGDGWGR
ncbi:hypothetical protein CRG98_024184 [Punica granatum]|uniref:Uncharacterized protein n=2 Tax=Punica granatum TaxID=22663 RepID=A0A2I0JGM7_PUNGR|nr:hypothetical protein CRG98_024184 [Punica granatum]